jgi:hypothetical protein
MLEQVLADQWPPCLSIIREGVKKRGVLFHTCLCMLGKLEGEKYF